MFLLECVFKTGEAEELSRKVEEEGWCVIMVVPPRL
jgi:hypothetical protein